MSMQAIMMTEDRRVVLTDRPVPVPAEDEVLCRVACCGVCGTDLHAVENSAFDPPVIMGHEFSGIVAEVGGAVTGWSVGDRLVANPNGFVCGMCRACRAGQYNLCHEATRNRDLGVAVDGGLAGYVALNPAYLNSVPDSMSLQQAAWVEPLGVAVRAVRTAPVRVGTKVAVIGLGAVGQLVAQVARAGGAASILGVEISTGRRRMAGELACDAVMTPDEAAEAIARTAIDDRFDVIFECSGAGPALQSAVDMARPGGAVRLVGMSPHPVSFDAVTAIMKEVSILTGFIYTPDDFRDAVTLLDSGRIDVGRLTTGVSSLEEAVMVLDGSTAPATDSVKTVVKPMSEDFPQKETI